MEVQLYDNNLASPTLLADLTGKIDQFRFSTKLNGGYYMCSFRIPATHAQAWDWITKRIFYRLLVTDRAKTLWEGRIEDVEFASGYAGIHAYGYYSNLTDIPYSTAYNANADVIIKAALTANCSQISSDQTNIAATDITITSTADATYLDITPQALVEKLLAFSDSTGLKWYFAIWENRIPYLFSRTVSSVDWAVSLENFERFRNKHRAGELYNSSYARYQSGGALARTTTANNTDSQTRYGVTRRKAIDDLGAVSSTAADAQRDAFLAEHKDIWPRIEDMVLGEWVYDAKGVRWPSSHVRAGQVIRVNDLVPASADAGAVARDALRTFYIVETSYNSDRSEMSIVVDTENNSLDAVLARKL